MSEPPRPGRRVGSALLGVPELGHAVRPARVARVARVVRLDARSGPLLAALPLFAVLAAVTGWRRLEPGVVDWDGAVAAANASVRWLGPAAAGLAAWTAVRTQRFDYLRALAARSPAVAALHDLALLVTVPLLGYAAGALVVSARALMHGDMGLAHPLGLAAGGCALAVQVILGYLAGRLWPNALTVLATAGAAAAWAALRPPGSWAALLPPAELGRPDLFDGLRASVLAAQLVWALGLAAALVLAHVAWLTRRGRLLTAAALALGVVGLATGRLETAGGVASGPARFSYICRDWPMRVCVHPALDEALPGLGASLAPLAARLAGTPGAFTQVVQRSPREPVRVARGTAVFHLNELSPGFERRAVAEIEGGLWFCPDPRRAAPGGLQAQVGAWLRDEPVPAAPSGPFTRWNEQQRRTWFAAHYAYYRACALIPAHFTG